MERALVRYILGLMTSVSDNSWEVERLLEVLLEGDEDE